MGSFPGFISGSVGNGWVGGCSSRAGRRLG